MHCGLENYRVSLLDFLILIIVPWLYKKMLLFVENTLKYFLEKGHDVYNFFSNGSEKVLCLCVCVCVYIYANEVKDKQVVNWQFLVLFLCS